MDEREVREILRGAAENLQPSPDLPARAERRYRHRRVRGRVLVSAVVIALVGSGIATAQMVGTDHGSGVVAPTSTTTPQLGHVNVKTFGSLAFVDAHVGYGVATAGGRTVLAKTQDGARTWHAVARMPALTWFVALTSESAESRPWLVAWGNSDLYLTNDDGAHWEKTLHNVENVESSTEGVWATTRCVRPEPCRNKLVGSNNGGRSWSTASLQSTYTVAVAASTAPATKVFAVELPTEQSRQFEIASSSDGVRWSREPTPCPDTGGPFLAVGGDGVSLMLVCHTDARDRVFVSPNQGRTWTETVALPSRGRVGDVSASNDSASTFVVGLRTAVGPGWDKGPLTYPVLDQWQWRAKPQPIGDVFAFAPVPGAGMFFAAATGVWFDHDGVRELETAPQRPYVTPTTRPTGSVDVRSIEALSFVDAKVGFGLARGLPVREDAAATSAVVRTDDGGRTWRRVGLLGEYESGLHFENARDGVAWGTGPLEWTTDGGAHWRAADGPVDNYLAWGGGRLWAMSPCVQSTPCGSRWLLTSDDAGRTWQQTAPLQQGLGLASIVALSKSVAYVVEPSTDQQPGPWQLAATKDGGGSWAYESVPCATWTEQPDLAVNNSTLLLVCAGQPAAGSQMKEVWSSSDDGRRWTPAARLEGGGYVSVLTNVGSTFVAALSRADLWSSTDGRSWRRETDTVQGFWAIATVPGVGAWAATGRADQNAGLLFSPDGVRWEQRSES